jgi:hypothetical protein
MADAKFKINIIDDDQTRERRLAARYRTDAQFHAIVKHLADWIETASPPVSSVDLHDACVCASMVSRKVALADFDEVMVEDFTIDLDEARQDRKTINGLGVIEFRTPPKMGAMESMKQMGAAMSALGAATAPVFDEAKRLNEQVEAMAKAVMLPTASGKSLASLVESAHDLPPRPFIDVDSVQSKPSNCSTCRHWQQRKRKGQRGKCSILGQLTKPSMGCTSWKARHMLRTLGSNGIQGR